jgi:hypothetical protein
MKFQKLQNMWKKKNQALFRNYLERKNPLSQRAHLVFLEEVIHSQIKSLNYLKLWLQHLASSNWELTNLKLVSELYQQDLIDLKLFKRFRKKLEGHQNLKKSLSRLILWKKWQK